MPASAWRKVELLLLLLLFRGIAKIPLLLFPELEIITKSAEKH